jgi:hypothetical protein
MQMWMHQNYYTRPVFLNFINIKGNTNIKIWISKKICQYNGNQPPEDRSRIEISCISNMHQVTDNTQHNINIMMQAYFVKAEFHSNVWIVGHIHLTIYSQPLLHKQYFFWIRFSNIFYITVFFVEESEYLPYHKERRPSRCHPLSAS